MSSQSNDHLCIQTVVAEPHGAVEQTRLCRQYRRPDTSADGAEAIDRCKHDENDDDTAGSGPDHHRCTGADTRDTAVQVTATSCQRGPALSETETLLPQSGRLAVMLSC